MGFLYPGHAAEDDYPRLAEILDAPVAVELVHTRVSEDAHRVDALLQIGGREVLAEGAEELGRRGVDACVWACTSGSFVFGWAGAGKQVRDLEESLGVPCSSTSFAFANALGALRARRVAIAATYPEDVAGHLADFLAHAGVETLGIRGQGIITAAEVGTLGRDRVLEFVSAGNHPEADVVLVPDTALHTAEWIGALEEAVGKPVLTANQVTMWEALRLVDTLRPQDGLGSLFRA